MCTTQRAPVTIVTTLATAARHLRRAVRAADPAQAPGLARLRETGWQLTQLTGELTDLVTLLAVHTGHHTQHPKQVIRAVDGTPATAQLARACRDLAALRHALEDAHTAARDYYTRDQPGPAGPAAASVTAVTVNAGPHACGNPYAVLGLDPAPARPRSPPPTGARCAPATPTHPTPTVTGSRP